MNTELNQNEGGARLRLSGGLNIYSAAEAKQSLMGGLAGHPRLEVDLSGVDSIDGAGLQVLALAARESGRNGKSLQLTGDCPPFNRLVALFHMNAHFAGVLQGQVASTLAAGEA